MTKIAVTGHRGLPPATAQLVDRALRDELGRYDAPIGISCLADGADQLFARVVLDAGGSLIAVVPAKKYREGLPAASHEEYDHLFEQATQVHQLDRIESDSESHMEASARMLDLADQLVAVWDGLPSRAFGGTADVVRLARSRGVPVSIIWPEGASRD